MDKRIFITGANRGIGLEIAKQCGKLGFKVIISGRNSGRLNDALEVLKNHGIDAESVVMDVSQRESILAAASLMASKNLKIDVLVNNAGISIKGDHSILEDDESILHRILLTNSYGPLYVTKALLPLLNPSARIIMISSSGGIMNGPVPGWSPAYCISKTLLNAFTKQIAYELKPMNIAVNAVSPGWVKTDMGGAGATRSLEKGAETPVWLATEAPLNLTGKFLKDMTEVEW